MALFNTLKQNLLKELSEGLFNAPAATTSAGVLGLFLLNKQIKTLQSKQNLDQKESTEDLPEAKNVVEISFSKRIQRLLPILIPQLLSVETGYIAALGLLLIARTGLSSIIADVSGKAASYIVSKRVDLAVQNLAGFIVFSIPASYVNGLLKYLTTRLSMRLRMNLSLYIHDRYLNGVNFYNISNLGGLKIDNVGERVTLDVKDFCDEISDVYTSTFKPIMDIIFFTYKLACLTTWRGPVILYTYFAFSSLCKMILTPHFGKLASRESQLQGDFRSAHERLITNSEEVAFYDGSLREKVIINKKLLELKNHIVVSALSKLYISVIDNVIIKYWATLAGYAAIYSPLLFGVLDTKDASELTEYYSKCLRYLTNLSDGIGNLVILGNKISELKGHTKRVGEIIEKMDDFETEKTIHFPRKKKEEHKALSERNDSFLQKWKETCNNRPKEGVLEPERYYRGVKLVEGEEIKFEHIDIVSPEGKVLVEDLSFTVKRNQNVMVTGPNGSGKSSLFRIIGDLWPAHAYQDKEGLIIKPRKTDIVFIPQKPYLVLGTLRDQIIYPHSQEQMIKNGVTDLDLAELLRIVDPHQYILKTWKWDDEKDWFHAFSGGQKQRIAMARLFYHRPHYAILDECTSAVSDEVEDEIYRACKTLGITLFTVSHRKYLRKHHECVLGLEGREGKWFWKQISDKEEHENNK